MQEEFEIEVDWRGFQLHPEVPPGGESVEELFGADRVRGFIDYLDRFAADFDVPIAQPPRIPNTRRALAVTEFARDEGRLPAFREAAMVAHWLDGKDIEDDLVLAELASASGLDPAKAVAAADDPEFLRRIEALREEASARKVTGIPTFFIGETKLVGCQAYPHLLRAAEKAGLKRRSK